MPGLTHFYDEKLTFVCECGKEKKQDVGTTQRYGYPVHCGKTMILKKAAVLSECCYPSHARD